MAMTVVVTRNVPERVRGFLASCMCELGPGAYTAPRMDAAVRDRVWDVLQVWCGVGGDLSVVMTWPEPKLPGGQGVRTLGTPPVELVEHNGVFLARRDLTEDDIRSLTTRFGGRVARDEERDAAAGGPVLAAPYSDGAAHIGAAHESDVAGAHEADAMRRDDSGANHAADHAAHTAAAESKDPAPEAPDPRSPPLSKT